MRDLDRLNRSLLKRGVSANVGFRTGATGEPWSAEIAAALQRMVEAGFVDMVSEKDGPAYKLRPPWREGSRLACGVRAKDDAVRQVAELLRSSPRQRAASG